MYFILLISSIISTLDSTICETSSNHCSCSTECKCTDGWAEDVSGDGCTKCADNYFTDGSDCKLFCDITANQATACCTKTTSHCEKCASATACATDGCESGYFIDGTECKLFCDITAM